MKKKLQKKIIKKLKESNKLSEQILKELESLRLVYENNSNSNNNSKDKNRTIPNVPKEDRTNFGSTHQDDLDGKEYCNILRIFKSKSKKNKKPKTRTIYDLYQDQLSGNEIPKPPKDRVNKEGEIPKPPKSKS